MGLTNAEPVELTDLDHDSESGCASGAPCCGDASVGAVKMERPTTAVLQYKFGTCAVGPEQLADLQGGRVNAGSIEDYPKLCGETVELISGKVIELVNNMVIASDR
jgi:hypothetical protein